LALSAPVLTVSTCEVAICGLFLLQSMRLFEETKPVTA
jgi:hypothetical protein